MTGLPSLGLISHGTSSALGQSLIEALAEAVIDDLRARGLVDEVMLGHVDVQDPGVDEVIDRLPADRPAVLVPLLLSPGYHVHVDLAEALEGAGDRDIRLASTLGPDPRLARILAERLPRLRDGDEVVLAAAGSSDERANASCEEMGRLLADELGRAVSVGFLAGGSAPLKAIVEQNRQIGSRLVIANYLLAPGFFDDLARTLISEADSSAESAPASAPDVGSDAEQGTVLASPLLAPGADPVGPSVAHSAGPSVADSAAGSVADSPGSSVADPTANRDENPAANPAGSPAAEPSAPTPDPRGTRADAVPAGLVDIVRDRLLEAL
ncbi:CbiX/SirB N-terminal domain-containing protein [Brevibacterium sp.]|uniref:sirohydrochlorin chelatase n=1 Tax=Brevibacterium sp. TaxID=1701 RepID=UPI002618DC0C|nr:CbiX/SirB N-terminal domain-containing protein [Brevibacterium sp.]